MLGLGTLYFKKIYEVEKRNNIKVGYVHNFFHSKFFLQHAFAMKKLTCKIENVTLFRWKMSKNVSENPNLISDFTLKHQNR